MKQFIFAMLVCSLMVVASSGNASPPAADQSDQTEMVMQQVVQVADIQVIAYQNVTELYCAEAFYLNEQKQNVNESFADRHRRICENTKTGSFKILHPLLC